MTGRHLGTFTSFVWALLPLCVDSNYESRNLWSSPAQADCGERSFDSRCKLYVKPAIAKICNTEADDLALQSAVSWLDQRFHRRTAKRTAFWYNICLPFYKAAADFAQVDLFAILYVMTAYISHGLSHGYERFILYKGCCHSIGVLLLGMTFIELPFTNWRQTPPSLICSPSCM